MRMAPGSICGSVNVRWLVVLVVLAAACGAGPAPELASVPTLSEGTVVGVTSSTPSGNRFVAGPVTLDERVEVDLDRTVEWVAGVPVDGGIAWVVALAGGSARGYMQSDGTLTEFPVEGRGRSGPISLVADPEGVRILSGPAGASDLSAPVLVGDRMVAILDDGSLAIDETRLDVGALVDSAITVSSDGLVAVVSGATDRYPHGILGDDQEGSAVTVADPLTGSVVTTIPAPEGFVFEAVSAMWADIDDDGSDEILVTASNGEVGARLLAFESSGALRAASEPIGRGGRWRHQVAVGPFGPAGEAEVVDVRVPHIGGILEFFRVSGPQLATVATAPGFSSHEIRSRNLDMGVALDVGGDGRVEVVVPSHDRMSLSAVGRVADETEVVWTFNLGNTLTSNVAAVESGDGSASMAAAAGTTLYVWP
jgi:hypothetical protein